MKYNSVEINGKIKSIFDITTICDCAPAGRMMMDKAQVGR